MAAALPPARPLLHIIPPAGYNLRQKADEPDSPDTVLQTERASFECKPKEVKKRPRKKRPPAPAATTYEAQARTTTVW